MKFYVSDMMDSVNLLLQYVTSKVMLLNCRTRQLGKTVGLIKMTATELITDALGETKAKLNHIVVMPNNFSKKIEDMKLLLSVLHK